MEKRLYEVFTDCVTDLEQLRDRCNWYKKREQAQNIEIAGLKERYNELIMAVKSIYPGESRHETALRFIQQGERRDSSPAKKALGQNDDKLVPNYDPIYQDRECKTNSTMEVSK